MESATVPQNESSSFTLTVGVYIILFLLGLWGCIAIYNATLHNMPFHYLGLQSTWLIIGMFALYLSSKIQFQVYQKYLVPLAVLSYIPMLFVLIWGVKVHGMSGWFKIGNIMMQPSEFAKTPFILLLSIVSVRIAPGRKHFGILTLLAMLWIIPIMLQPDFGTMLVYLSGFVVVYFISNGDMKMLAYSALAVVPGIIYIFLRKQYVLDRFSGYLNPMADQFGAGWHAMQFRYSIANGGFWGCGLGKSIWSNSYLPLSHSDSAFASFCEAVGFVGAVPVLAGFLFLVFIAFRISNKIQCPERKVFILAIASLIAIQALIHISVNLTLLPTTGITLPLFSYGGSSLVSTFISFGVMLSASRVDYS